MKLNLTQTLGCLVILLSLASLSGCGGDDSPNPPPPTGGGGGGGDGGDGGDTSTSYRQFVRDAYAQMPTDAPLTVNDKEFSFDVMDTAEFDDLVQGGTVDGGSN